MSGLDIPVEECSDGKREEEKEAPELIRKRKTTVLTSQRAKIRR